MGGRAAPADVGAGLPAVLVQPLGGAERRPVRGGQQAQHAVPEHPRAQEQEGRAPVLGRLSRQALSLSNKGYRGSSDRFRGNSAGRLVGRKSGRRWITRVRSSSTQAAHILIQVFRIW